MFSSPNRRETNRTVTRFTHKGKPYRIHERSSSISDGSRYTRRFILNEDGDWCGEAKTVREARKVLDASDLSCRRCGSAVNINGHCADETCPYSDRPQDATFTEE